MANFNIRFVTDDSLISKAIRLETKSLFSHTEIVLEDGSYLGAHQDGGVQIRPRDYMNPTLERRYAIPVSDDQLKTMLSFAQSQVGKPYDTTDIIGILLDFGWSRQGSWICSELVAATAEVGNLFMLNIQPGFTNRITPEMLHLSPYLIGHCYYNFQSGD